MKTLYVEDEIYTSKGIGLFLDIWGDVFDSQEKTQLEEVADESYANPKKAKEICQNNLFVNVEYDFLDALQLIESTAIKEYDYYVLDRNLGKKYSIEQIRRVFKKFSDEEYAYINNKGDYGREGDFLLKRLFIKFKEKLRGRVFFLSNYPTQDVFDNNDVLRDIVLENRILNRKYYIDKTDSRGIERLKNTVASLDKEEAQLYMKWGNVLSYFDKYDKCNEIRKTIISALKTSSYLSSKGMSDSEAEKRYFTTLTTINKYYKRYFRKEIDGQTNELFKKKTKGLSEKDWQAIKNAFYSTAKIPRNIVEISQTILTARNNPSHDVDQNDNVDVSGLTLLASAYAFLEIARFWQDREEKDNNKSSQS